MKHKNIFRILAVAVTLALLVVAIPATPALAVANLYVDPEEGEIFDDITVTGTGLLGSKEINVFFARQEFNKGDNIFTDVTTYKFITQKDTDTSGNFTLTFPIPAEITEGPGPDEDVYGGMYYVYVTYPPSTEIIEKASVRVIGHAEVTGFDPDEGTVGTEVEIAGEGFSPEEVLTVEYDGDEINIESGDEETDEDGEFELTIIIPESIYGEHTITVKGEDSLAELEETFTVISEIAIEPETGEAGTLVTITGTGFDRYSDVVITFNGDEVKTKRAGSDGSFDTFFTVPELYEGIYTIFAEDEDDDDIWADAEFTVIVVVPPLNPVIDLSGDSGNVGDEITVTGTEFASDDTVTIYLDGVSIGTTPTNEDGNFTFDFDIPASPGGSHTIKAEDTEDHSDTATVTVEPEMSMTPLTGVVNDEIDVSGTGFSADEDITIMYGTAALTQTAQITTGPEGSFSGSFIVPAIPGGSRTLTVTDGTNSLTEDFTMEASIIVNPTSGIIGSGVGAGGFGFGVSKPITILVNNSPVTLLAPITTSPEGTFSNAQFYVPATPGGTATITITDGTTSVNTSFTVLAATASTNPTTGNTGTTVTVSGTNFAAGGTVTIKYYLEAGSTTGDFEEFTATAGSDGVLSTTFDVPASEGGNHTIVISDGTSSISANFMIETSDISISSETSTASPGYIGMEVSISGDGYAADVPVEVTYASDPVVLYSGTTDSSGSLTADFTIPESPAGEHTITVSVDDVEVEQFTFVMESTPPGVPALMILYLGVKAEQPIYLDWLEVTDDSSPVTYNLQIAIDESFSNIVLSKTELTETEYTLTEAEELEPVSKNAPYYWHINAVDGAGNVSEWSDADSFYIGGGWPGWLTWLLIGLGILTVFIFALWLGRRIAFSSY